MSAVPDGTAAAELAAAASACGIRIRATVAGTSMLPAIRPGDIVLARPFERAGVREGDIVLFRSRGGLCAHRVIAIRREGLVTRGDAIRRDDGLLPPHDVIGIVERIRRGGLEWTPPRSLASGQRAVAAVLGRSSLLRGIAGKLSRIAASHH